MSNSKKPTHACGATQDGQVMVERPDRMWSTGEGNGKPLQYSCLENAMNSRKKQNDRIPKEELPRSLGAQYATGDEWRNNSRKNVGMEPKQKQYPTGLVVKNPPANGVDLGLIPGLRRSPGIGNSKPRQYSCLGNPTD